MKLAETRYDNRETGCCAPVDPARWNHQTMSWRSKPFLKSGVRALLHVPLNFGSAMRRAHAAIEAAAAYPQDPFWLSDEISPWRSDLYVAVDREVPEAEFVRLDGTFFTKVFEGPFRDAGRWVEEMKDDVAVQGRDVRKIYFFYATCPKCAKHFGRNQVVLFAQLD
jgi:hypothetical protein